MYYIDYISNFIICLISDTSVGEDIDIYKKLVYCYILLYMRPKRLVYCFMALAQAMYIIAAWWYLGHMTCFII